MPKDSLNEFKYARLSLFLTSNLADNNSSGTKEDIQIEGSSDNWKSLIAGARFRSVKEMRQDLDALTWNNIIFNSMGLPVISIPCGLTKDRMPVGAQIVGSPFDESKILILAYDYERNNDTLTEMILPL